MTPSVGRIVHAYVPTGSADSNGVRTGPFAALITQVFNSGDEVTYCNLKVFRPFAPDLDIGSVPEKGSRFHSDGGSYWEWPPRA